jgi:hypothetical protein
LAEGAVFCKRCGTASRGILSKPSDKLAELVAVLAITTGAVGLGGLIVAFVLARELLKRGIEPSALGGTLFITLAAVFGVTWLLARQSSRALNAYLHPFTAPEATPAQLEARRTAELIEAPREPPSSVTDHTTRTFDPVLVERAKK